MGGDNVNYLRQTIVSIGILAFGFTVFAAYAQSPRTEPSAKMLREKISASSQSDCDFSRECAEAQAKFSIPQTLAKQCLAVSGPEAVLERVRVSRGSCASMGKGREDRKNYRCVVQATAFCVAPFEEEIASEHQPSQ